MKTELHFSQKETDNKIHYYGIIPTDDALGYKLVEEDSYWMNRTFIGYFKTKSEAKKYLSDCMKK